MSLFICPVLYINLFICLLCHWASIIGLKRFLWPCLGTSHHMEHCAGNRDSSNTWDKTFHFLTDNLLMQAWPCWLREASWQVIKSCLEFWKSLHHKIQSPLKSFLQGYRIVSWHSEVGRASGIEPGLWKHRDQYRVSLSCLVCLSLHLLQHTMSSLLLSSHLLHCFSLKTDFFCFCRKWLLQIFVSFLFKSLQRQLGISKSGFQVPGIDNSQAVWLLSPQMHVYLEPQNGTLFRNRVFADVSH